MKMRVQKKLFLFFFAFSVFWAQSVNAQTLKQAFKALKAQDYVQAKGALKKISQEERQENETAWEYARARTRWGLVTEKVKAIRFPEDRFYNYAEELKSLETAYASIKKANELFYSLTAERKEKYAHWDIHSKTLYALENAIAQQAADLLLNAPYAKPLSELRQRTPYDKPENLDTLRSLKVLLIQQQSQYVDFFKANKITERVKNRRNALLKEYMTLPGLRQNGTGQGHLYEKFCTKILRVFPEKELQHVLAEMYGEEFGWEKFREKNNSNYLKIKTLADKEKLSVLDFLCQLSLHHIGCTPENEALYDAFIPALAPHEMAYVALQRRAAPALEAKQWAEAHTIYERFLPHFSGKAKAKIITILDILKTPEDNIEIKNLGSIVNSSAPETYPVVSADGKRLYFCRYTPETGEDVFSSAYADGGFSLPQKIEGGVNTNTHEVPLSVSHDGQTLVFFGNYALLPEFRYKFASLMGQLGRGDLYYSEFTREGWSELTPFLPPINSPNYESGLFLTPDGKAALFASDREGVIEPFNPKAPPNRLYAHGAENFNVDLFVSEKNEEGKWGKPVNLGDVINTAYSEGQPILHPDMKTLYFISDGHAGLGGYDIFMSKRLSEYSWTEWSAPVNLGKVLNTAKDDGFSLSPHGELAYLSREIPGEGQGQADLYSMKIPLRFLPEKTVEIKGKVKNTDGQGIAADLHWQDLKSGEIIGTARTNPQTGEFRIQVQSGKNYGLFAEKKGHIGIANNQDLTVKINPAAQQEADLQLTTLERVTAEKKRIRLNTIFFAFDSDVLLQESYPELERLAQLLRENPRLKVRIEGHTDNKGKASYNLQLSEKRARATANYLIQKGIVANRVKHKGFGDTVPIATNHTAEGRAQNRRVEFALKFMGE